MEPVLVSGQCSAPARESPAQCAFSSHISAPTLDRAQIRCTHTSDKYSRSVCRTLRTEHSTPQKLATKRQRTAVRSKVSSFTGSPSSRIELERVLILFEVKKQFFVLGAVAVGVARMFCTSFGRSPDPARSSATPADHN